MTDRLSPRGEFEIGERLDAARSLAAEADWPLSQYRAISQQQADTGALLTELAAVRAERDDARARVRELERPAVEAHRNEIRQSYAELAAAARETRDYEGALDVECQLREREEQWRREDTATTP